MEQSSPWEANRFSASQEIPRILWNLNFITAFKNARQPPLSWATSIHSMPISRFLKIHLILPSTPGFSKWLLSLRFPLQTLYTPLVSTILVTCPAHLTLPDLITRTILGEEYKSLSSSSCNVLHSCVRTSLLVPNILLSTLFSNTLSLRSSLSVIDWVSHPYKRRGEIVVIYMLIFIFLSTRLDDKRFCAEW